MGAWGTAIFSDDTALDIRDEWRKAVVEGLTAEEATARLVRSFDDYLADDEDTAKLFWLALAAAQFETGRLLPEVRDHALTIIDGGGDVTRWLEDGDNVAARERERVLERLAAKLRGPQPKPKRIRRRRSLSVEFDVGDVVRVYDEVGRDDALVVVVGHLADRDERDPVVAALDWHGGAIPSVDALRRLPLLRDLVPEKPLLIHVSTLSKEQIFGQHIGEVVAKGVTPHEPVDPDRFGASMSWGLVPISVRERRAFAERRAER